MLYHDMRAHCGLFPNPAQHTFRRVSANRKAARTRGERVKTFDPTSIQDDQQIFSFIEREWRVSLTLLHGVGHRRCQVQLTDLLSYIPRDEVDGGLHFRHPPLGFLNPLHAGLTEAFVLSHAAHAVNLSLDICRNKLTIAPHTAL